MRVKILLLQARRPDDPARFDEVASFARKIGVPVEQLATHDLLDGPPSLSAVRAHDALMIGGSGEFYVSKGNLPRFDALLDLLREVVAVGHPTFASCFGFQCLVVALGGEIVHDPENTEVGTLELELTEDGRSDPLMSELPPAFHAQLGRKDRASRLPDGVLGLASSERCPHQALRVSGQPIWASQFHPELDHHENRRRFEQYLDGYARFMSAEERADVLSCFRDTSPEVLALLPRFLQLVFG